MREVVTFTSSIQPLKESSRIIPIFCLKNKNLQTLIQILTLVAHNSISCRRYTFEAEYWIHIGRGLQTDEAWSPSWPHHIFVELEEAAEMRWAPYNTSSPVAVRMVGFHPSGSCCLIPWGTGLPQKLQSLPEKEQWPSKQLAFSRLSGQVPRYHTSLPTPARRGSCSFSAHTFMRQILNLIHYDV